MLHIFLNWENVFLTYIKTSLELNVKTWNAILCLIMKNISTLQYKGHMFLHCKMNETYVVPQFIFIFMFLKGKCIIADYGFPQFFSKKWNTFWIYLKHESQWKQGVTDFTFYIWFLIITYVNFVLKNLIYKI